MIKKEPFTFRQSRRDAVKKAAIVLGAGMLPAGALAAAPPRHRRYNVSDPQHGPRMLASYKKAVSAMLALPPEDPRNWYRHALIHTMDCPHGNWWFLPWHRAYIGWFEQICRELSGDPGFTLPYWDWTQEPRIPDLLFDGVLDPAHAEFIPAGADFESRFKGQVASAGYWSNPSGSFSPTTQYGQLLKRMIRFPEDLWFDILRNPMGSFFFDQPNTRGLSRQKPDFSDTAKSTVALKTLYPALYATDFTTFGSLKSASHSRASGSGILENQPHNNVHNCVGTLDCNLNDSRGFMVDMLSPIDPIFFLHHANIDRLWDVWTRKQSMRNLPTLPDGYALKTSLPDDKKSDAEKSSDYYRWATEPVLFYIDAKGTPVSKTMAGDYETIGDFDYDYQPGSGEDVVSLALEKAKPGAPQVRTYGATIHTRSISPAVPGRASVRLPRELLARPAHKSNVLVARITLNFPPDSHAPHVVVLGAPPNASEVQFGSPFYAATLSMFGHHPMSGPFTFIVPITEPVRHLHSNKLVGTDGKVDIHVVPQRRARSVHPHHAQAGGAGVEVVSVTVEAY